MKRRRFLQIACASALACPAQAQTARGVALGADVEITLHGRHEAGLIEGVWERLAEIERAFSLYDPSSEISRINAGERGPPSPLFAELLAHVNAAHSATHGLFDPTVQALFVARLAGDALPYGDTGWAWPLAPRQQITLNGIAQGFAADLVRRDLARMGVRESLVNIGEFAAIGGPWHLEVRDKALSLPVSLTGRARATTSDAPHLFHPKGGLARWSTISIEAADAVWADALSTALLFADEAEIEAALAGAPGAPTALVIDQMGNAKRIS